MKNILITGGAGFIGINFINNLLMHDRKINIHNIDSLTYAANTFFLKKLEKFKNYKFHKIDISNKKKLHNIFSKKYFDAVINFAAESHVDNSIKNPQTFISTNIIGTFNLLELCYKSWMSGPFKYKKNHIKSVFIQISTDEVYGSLSGNVFANEEFKFLPNSPYSSSKASAELLVRSFNKTYGLNTLTTNCTNNYGPFQNIEKLIPKSISNALNGKKIPIYGNGKNIRDWIYVNDHCDAILKILQKGKFGETYNISSNCQIENNKIVLEICRILDKKFPKSKGKYSDQIKYVNDRPGHDFRYAVDSNKIEKLGWRPKISFDKGIELTIDWYIKHHIIINKK